jgi:multiple sugar transport system ATP-binding protein
MSAEAALAGTGNGAAARTEPRLRLSGVAKRFGKTIAVFPTDLSVQPGELLVILGPSGCGKTTTLRMVAGLEDPTQGSIHIDGRDVTPLKTRDRDVAFVFQMFALYPHLTALENVTFPLLAAGLPAAEANRRGADMLRRLGLEPLAHHKPRSLSGGDKQRVGLARSLVRQPKAFLMDEPLGLLDGALRETTRETLKAIHAETRSTTLFVTHDQEEAMGLADRVAVMKDGRILQVDHPRAVYENPANLFVADFVGSPGMNLVPGRREGEHVRLRGLDLVARVHDGEPAPGDPPRSASTRSPDCWLGVRPENVLISETGAPCLVEHVEALGSHNMLTARLEGDGGILRAWLPAGVRFREGQKVGLTVLPSGCRWFDAASGDALPWKTLEAACPATR